MTGDVSLWHKKRNKAYMNWGLPQTVQTSANTEHIIPAEKSAWHRSSYNTASKLRQPYISGSKWFMTASIPTFVEHIHVSWCPLLTDVILQTNDITTTDKLLLHNNLWTNGQYFVCKGVFNLYNNRLWERHNPFAICGCGYHIYFTRSFWDGRNRATGVGPNVPTARWYLNSVETVWPWLLADGPLAMRHIVFSA